jgi:hypothetical protein
MARSIGADVRTLELQTDELIEKTRGRLTGELTDRTAEKIISDLQSKTSAWRRLFDKAAQCSTNSRNRMSMDFRRAHAREFDNSVREPNMGPSFTIIDELETQNTASETQATDGDFFYSARSDIKPYPRGFFR